MEEESIDKFEINGKIGGENAVDNAKPVKASARDFRALTGAPPKLHLHNHDLYKCSHFFLAK